MTQSTQSACAGRFALRSKLAALALLMLLASPSLQAGEDGRFHLAVYGGKAAKERMLDIITRFDTGFIDSWLVAVAPGYVHFEGDGWRSEVEGQLVRHWGEQDHWELNAAYILRWMRFPWDHHVDTRAAIGAGLSWASEVPFIEPRAKELGEEDSKQFLGYVMLELEFAPPGDSPWSGFVRLHHRSDAFGTFHNKRGGSNFITLGTRYQF
jgi:hypothetical protein